MTSSVGTCCGSSGATYGEAVKRLLLVATAAVLISGCGTASNATDTAPVPSSSTTSAVASPPVSVSSQSSETSTDRPTTPSTTIESSTTAEAAAESVATPPIDTVATGTLITTAGSDYGEILFDETGQAIYLFDAETSSTPGCYDDCALAWPPVLTVGDPRAGGAIDASLLGVTTRSDGAVQVTYRDHPLYYYADEGTNEVTCHNVDEYGGLWLVVTPSGGPAAA